jgi:hypothetical protein
MQPHQYNECVAKLITEDSGFDSEQGSTKVLGQTHVLLQDYSPEVTFVKT